MMADAIMNNHFSAIYLGAKSQVRSEALCVKLFRSHHPRSLFGAGASFTTPFGFVNDQV
jgi:hypothetical protein